MATSPKTPKNPLTPDLDEVRHHGRTREELIADLGLDDLTFESCARDLFAELAAEFAGDRDPFASSSEPAGRVIQMGPGRRTTEKSE